MRWAWQRLERRFGVSAPVELNRPTRLRSWRRRRPHPRHVPHRSIYDALGRLLRHDRAGGVAGVATSNETDEFLGGGLSKLARLKKDRISIEPSSKHGRENENEREQDTARRAARTRTRRGRAAPTSRQSRLRRVLGGGICFSCTSTSTSTSTSTNTNSKMK